MPFASKLSLPEDDDVLADLTQALAPQPVRTRPVRFVLIAVAAYEIRQMSDRFQF
jgi:hypothetical protein